MRNRHAFNQPPAKKASTSVKRALLAGSLGAVALITSLAASAYQGHQEQSRTERYQQIEQELNDLQAQRDDLYGSQRDKTLSLRQTPTNAQLPRTEQGLPIGIRGVSAFDDVEIHCVGSDAFLAVRSFEGSHDRPIPGEAHESYTVAGLFDVDGTRPQTQTSLTRYPDQDASCRKLVDGTIYHATKELDQ